MRHRLALPVLALFLICVAAGSRAAEPGNWPALRGADGRGVSSETALPITWSATDNVLWKTAIPGRGHSSPIVWGDRIFLTTAIKGEAVPGHEAVKHNLGEGMEDWVHPDSVDVGYVHQYRVLALDAGSGAIVWDVLASEGLPYDNRHSASSYASPTAVTDGEHVYAYFGTAGLHAFDFDGNLLWSADLGKVATLGMGVGTSPLLYGDLVIVQVDRELGEDSYITALDRRTGEPVWSTERHGIEVSWTTPALVGSGDDVELVTSGNQFLVGYDPATGEELWRMDGLHSNSIHQPLLYGDTVIFTAGYPEKVVKAIRTGGRGQLDESHLAWSYNKGTAYVASSLVVGDYLYVLADNGVVTCLNASTGEIVYEGGRPPVPQKFFASPIAWDGKILLPGEDGEMFVMSAGPEFEILATNSMDEKVWASPAIANGRLYIRGLDHLFAIGEAR